MAEIFLARSSEFKNDVCLKVSRMDSRQQPAYGNALKLEADILSKLSHQNVLKLLPLPLSAKFDPYVARAVGITGQPWYCAMELMKGGSLSALQKDAKKFPLDVTCAIGVQLINALYYLHSVRVAHLDMKSENVLLRYPLVKGARVEPVLIDFGVSARSMYGDASGGTLMVMSPEYLRRSKGMLAPEVNLDLGKVDIYALGVLMYKLWTGQYPFGGLTERSLTSSILNTSPQSPCALNPGLPRGVDQLMRRWLSKDPRERPNLPKLKYQLSYWAGGLTHMQESLVSARKRKLFG